ncbi:GspH/FimT family pseudopilin [Maricaulis sp.]|uniref:GspH/FimT family pseudopilin n=1 Tax=Maricaulis sp. TaxID=1486257 RepID=UPI0025BEE05F|nr:GspH/FimT family pseudopilin [Maricaulis sp.]
MRQGRTYRGREAGLSLIEILVGVSILATVAFVVSLSFQPTRPPLDEAADRLAARLQVASEEAVTSGVPVGLVIEEFGAGYAFHRYVDRRWWPLTDHPALRARQLPDSVRLVARDVMFARDDAAAVPVIWFDPAGLTEPFRLRLETAEAAIDLDWQPDGGLTRQAGL